jgi:hypothetical protein
VSTEKRIVIAVAAIIACMAIIFFWPDTEPVTRAPEPPEPVVSGPCGEPPENREAEAMDGGPFETLDVLCADWRRGASCERVRADEQSPLEPFDDVFVIARPRGEDDTEATAALVFDVDGGLYRRNLGGALQDHEAHSFEQRSAHDDHPYVLAKVTLERRFHHQPDNPDGPVQIIRSEVWHACGVGPSGAPSCIAIPRHFRRETRRPNQPPEDIADSELDATFCDNGLLLYEGETTRLSGKNAENAEALLGLSRFIFL